MPQFQPFNYGNAIATGQNIRNARTQNQIAQQNSRNNQTKFDQNQQIANTKLLNMAAAEIAQDPRAVARWEPQLMQSGIFDPNMRLSELPPEELQASAAKIYESTTEALRAYQASGSQAANIYGKYNPGDYTPASFAKFRKSQNPEDLVRYEPPSIRKIGGVQNLVERSGGGGNVRALGSLSDEATGAETLSGATERGKLTQQLDIKPKLNLAKEDVKRLSILRDQTSSRRSSLKKARKFLDAMKSGQFHSGAMRRGLSFIPGVFTSQAQFDEEFDASTEIAARKALKASGEIRPTDADVVGMKRAMFGAGRDEETNINLLTQFIEEQQNNEDELKRLMQGGSSITGQQKIGESVNADNADFSKMTDDELLNF